MAVVNTIFFCRTCGEDLSNIHPDHLKGSCPFCSRSLKTPARNNFGSPDYLLHQKDSLLKDMNIDKLKPIDRVSEQKIGEIEDELIVWARTCPDEDRTGAMGDAIILLQEAVHSTATVDVIKQMTSVGKSIGKLAEAIEQYFRSGGSRHDRKTRLLPPELRDDAGNQASATASRNS